ncbi:MAG: TRM11 family SAM-dependent methyltransferase [Nannocystales bacterium]
MSKSSSPGRRALDNTGGKATAHGDDGEGARLASILDGAQARDVDWLTHGFHSYPARMHPAVARGVLAAYATPGDRVLDPFCGSGTVLVESLIAGMRSRGVDLNPIAVRLSGVKCQVRDAKSRGAFAKMLDEVVEVSKERVRRKAPAMAPLSPQERKHYEVHVLKELAGLHDIISAIDAGPDKTALQMLLTAIVVKFSKQRADTADDENTTPRRIGRFIPSEFYGRKGAELVERWASLEEACVARKDPWHRPKVVEADASRISGALPPRWAAHLVLTSPPYGGTYDYVNHHARRYPWLGVSTKSFSAGELGARRNYGSGGKAQAWDDEVSKMLGSMEGALEDQGQIVLLMGDGEIAGKRVDVVPQLQTLCSPLGLRVVAWASQSRTDWKGGTPRGEHLILIRRGESRQW